MATSIGSIVVEFIANLAGFKTDVAEAANVSNKAARGIDSAFKSIGGSVSGAISSMVNFRTVIGSALGSAGLGLMIKNAVQAGEEIVNMAQRVGVSTTALQELSHAARASGASVADLEQGLTILNRRLGEAQAGEKAAIEAFRTIGIDPTKFRDAGEAIGAVSDGLLTLGTEAQRTASQLDLFGKGSGQLTGLLKEGSAGIAGLSRAAHELGIVLDAELLKKSKEMSDTLNVLAEVAKVNLMKALIDLGPTLVGIAQKMAAAAKAGRELFESYKDIVATNETASLTELANRIVDITAKIEKLRAVNKPGSPLIADPKELAILEAERTALRDLLRVRQSLEANPDRNKPKTDLTLTIPRAQIDAVEEFRRKLVLMAIASDETARKMVELKIDANKLKDANPAVAASIDVIAAAMGRLITEAGAEKALVVALEEIEAEFKSAADAERSFAEAFGGTTGGVEAVEAAINQLLDTIEGGGFTIDGVTMSFKAMAAEQGPLQEGISGTRTALDDAGNAARKAGEALKILVETPFEKYTRQVKEINALYDDLGAKTIDQETYDRALAKAKDDLINATERVTIDLQQQIDVMSMSGREAAIYAAQLKVVGENMEEVRARAGELAGQLYDLKQQQADQAKLQQDLSNVVLNTTLSVSDALVDMALTGKASFKDLADAIIRDMTRIIIKMLVLKAVEMTIAAFGGGGASLGTAQGAGTQTAGADVLRGYAQGGVIKHRPGGTVIVAGEGGHDELITPLDGTMHQVGSGGGVTVVNEIHNHTDARVTTQQSQGADGWLINKIIVQAMNSAIADGSVDNSMKAAYGSRRVGVSR